MRIRIFYWKTADWCSKVSFDEALPTPDQIKADYGLVYDHDRLNLPYGDEQICQSLFRQFNLKDMIGQKVAKAVGHTSMSIGDIIDLAGDAYIVRSIGFSKVELPLESKV